MPNFRNVKESDAAHISDLEEKLQRSQAIESEGQHEIRQGLCRIAILEAMSAALPGQTQLPPVTTVAPADETQPLATPPISTSELLALLQNMSRSAQQAALASQVPPASPLCFPAPTPVFNWLIFHASLGQCSLWCVLSAFSVSRYRPLKPSYEFQGGIYVQAEHAFSKYFPNFESFYYPLSRYFSILHAHVLSGNHSPVSTNFILGTSSYLALLCSWYLEYD
ncbi:hypothetical protein BU17DRAFT_66026 [Hysterangium stoloniferum]|nr:hypothetical protein BU17DRAFT_66026 [Hysterangium stoloniferum]